MPSTNPPIRSVIVYLDQNVGQMRRTAREDQDRLAGMDFFPSARLALDQIRQKKLRVTLIIPESLSVEEVQEAKKSLGGMEPVLATKDNLRAVLLEQIRKPAESPEQIVFVAADRVFRGVAAAAGFRAAPHPLAAEFMAQGSRLHFVRASGERERFRRLPSVLPYLWEPQADGRWSWIGIFSDAALSEAIARGFAFECLRMDISVQDPVIVRRDGISAQEAGPLSRFTVAYADDHQILLGLGPDDSSDLLSANGQHGSIRLLLPCPYIMQPAPKPGASLRNTRLMLEKWPLEKTKAARGMEIGEIVGHVHSLPVPSTAANFESDVKRYSGQANLDTSGPVVSRHIQHPDQARVVQALQDELNGMGLCAYTHSFSYGGKTLYNVIADIPGTGYYIVNPELLELLRKIFWRYPWPDPPGPWWKELKELLRKYRFSDPALEKLSPLQIRALLEEFLNFKPWYPWWLKHCKLPGPGAQIVIIGGHLDDTASSSPGYHPATDSAPGADDNASGIAATLACARYLVNWGGHMVHTVRFCFFHAEEQGMVGSQAYAAMLKASGAPMKAAVLTDMIAYNSDAANLFEIHAGYTDPAIRDLNLPIAETIANYAAGISTLQPAQIYQGTNRASGADRTVYDGAIDRSDHASFHQQGYPAVVVSEDFFVNLASEPGADPNPNYHKNTDTTVASSYGSDITTALAYAVKDLASS